tara:strand:+ start:1656 stop:2030 length:375 start_codon:yes stop_codon:yes gene_type:complete
MKYDIASALQALKPGAEWVLRGDQYSGLEWLDEKQTVPTEKEVTDKIAELDAAEGMRLLRVERDAKLAALDWEVVKAYSNGAAVDANLKNYMQALRDLPASAKPTTDAAGELVDSSVTWPTRAS